MSQTWITKPMIEVHNWTFGQEDGDRIGRRGPFARRRRHVQLLLDDRRADRGEADHQRDDLQVLRVPQQLEGFGHADALLLLDRGHDRTAGRSRWRIIATSAAQTSISVPLISSMLVVPI